MKKNYNNDIILMYVKKEIRIGLEDRMGTSTSKNKFIKKTKRKRLIRKSIFIILVCLIAGSLVILKSGFFTVKNVNIRGENLITKNLIDEKLKYIKGKNIFFVKSSEIDQKLKSDPYIDKITLKRKLPATVQIDIKEKNVGYYVKCGNEYDVISSDLVLLEKVTKLKGDGLIKLTGIKSDERKIGEKYIDTNDDKRLEEFLGTLYQIKNANTTKHKITMVDVGDVNNFVIYFNDVKVKVGNGNDLIKKVNIALNILEDKKLNFKKGYIDLSFDGAPVIKEEK